MNLYRKICVVGILLILVLALTGCCLSHEWEEATCAAPKTCAKCGETEGELLPHTWKDATCTAPKTCDGCGATEGAALGHTWEAATCEAPKTCSVCGETQGDALGHKGAETSQERLDCVNLVRYQDTICETCGQVIATSEAPLEVLHQDKMFLMSPQEFADRLNQSLKIYTDLELRAECTESNGKTSVGIISCYGFEGNFGFFNTNYEDEKFYVYDDMAQQQSCYDSTMAMLSRDEEIYAKVVIAAIRACDPTVDSYAKASEIYKNICARVSYAYNDIMYIFSPLADRNSSVLTIGFPQ